MRVVLFLSAALTVAASAQQADSGRGLRTSMQETYVAKHELLVFPFGALSRDHNFEYQPSNFGVGSDQDYRGHFRTNEAQLFLAYGITDWLAVEVQTSDIHARFQRAPDDTTGTPAAISQAGVSDLEGQIRMRLGRERGRRPEFFAGIEILPPIHPHQSLIGDGQWDVKGEIGATRTYGWGALTLRTTIEYNRGDTHWDLGESSLEFLRPVSRTWRLFAAVEGGEGGAPDDWTLVTAASWRIGNGVFLKFGNSVGIFSKATDWEPQVGVLWAIH